MLKLLLGIKSLKLIDAPRVFDWIATFSHQLKRAWSSNFRDNEVTLLGANQFMLTISLLDATKDEISNLKSMRLNTFVIVTTYTLKVSG